MSVAPKPPPLALAASPDPYCLRPGIWSPLQTVRVGGANIMAWTPCFVSVGPAVYGVPRGHSPAWGGRGPGSRLGAGLGWTKRRPCQEGIPASLQVGPGGRVGFPSSESSAPWREGTGAGSRHNPVCHLLPSFTMTWGSFVLSVGALAQSWPWGQSGVTVC